MDIFQKKLIKYEIWMFVGFFLYLALLPFSYIVPAIILGAGFLIVLFLILFINKGDVHFLFSLCLISLFLRVILGIFMYEALPFLGKWKFMGDGYPYFINANNILDMWVAGERNIGHIFNYVKHNISSTGTLGNYDFWNAMVLLISDRAAITIVYINIVAAIATIVFTYQITIELTDCNKNAARLSAILCAFWPSTLLWSVQNYKEPLTILFVAGLAWSFVSVVKRFRFYYVFMLLFFGAGLRFFREPIFVVFCFGVIPIALFIHLFQHNIRRNHLFVFLVLCLALGAAFFSKIYSFFSSLDVLFGSFLDYAYIMRTGRSYGNLAFLQNVDFTNSFNLFIFLPVSFLTVLLAPFPWQLVSLSRIPVLPETVLYYALVFFMFKGVSFLVHNRTKGGNIIIVAVFVMMTLLAFFEGNIGTMYRHRAIMLPFVFILASIGIEADKNRAKEML